MGREKKWNKNKNEYKGGQTSFNVVIYIYIERESLPRVSVHSTALRLSTHEPRERRVSADPTKPSENNKKRKESAGQSIPYIRALLIIVHHHQPVGIILMKTWPSHGRRCCSLISPISTCVYYTLSRSSTKDLIQSSQHGI